MRQRTNRDKGWNFELQFWKDFVRCTHLFSDFHQVFVWQMATNYPQVWRRSTPYLAPLAYFLLNSTFLLLPTLRLRRENHQTASYVKHFVTLRLRDLVSFAFFFIWFPSLVIFQSQNSYKLITLLLKSLSSNSSNLSSNPLARAFYKKIPIKTFHIPSHRVFDFSFSPPSHWKGSERKTNSLLTRFHSANCRSIKIISLWSITWLRKMFDWNFSTLF
jgi:hypothetical protein